jgi:predicted phage terminase large subunit-like protein
MLATTDGWDRADKLELMALLERRAVIEQDREAEEKRLRAAHDHEEMMAAVAASAAKVRKRCQSFTEFVKLAWKIIEPGTELKWNWHLDAMCWHLEAISRGTLHPRLIINVPPGSSKSTIVSVLWQAWEWGPLGKRHLRYVSTSFELGNVKRDTGKTRDLIQSEWYQALWPEVELNTKGKLSFSNTDTGFRLGVAFASVMGKRGDRLVVDDPHSLKGAESELQRNGVIQLFIEGGLNRTNDAMTSAIVIVMQRVHADDLTGALLAKDFGFIHLMIPMEFEPVRRCVTPLKVDDGNGGKKDWTDPRSYDGELMDPVRVPPPAIEVQKLAGDYAWAGQYQQRPAPREGGMFKVDLIEVVPYCPAGGKTVSGWDFAASKRKTSPFTVRVKMTRLGGDYYIRHVERRRTNPTELSKMISEVAIDDGHGVLQSLPQDPGSAGKVQKWAVAELLAGFVFKITTESGDKETRAEPFAAQVGAGRVFMVKGDWNDAYKEELRNFPAGSFKDQVDASSRAFAELVGATQVPDNAGAEVVEVDDEEAFTGEDDDDAFLED